MKVKGPYPIYKGLSENDWKEKIEKAKALLQSCRLCPRECEVDRTAGEKGVCRAGGVARVSSANDHHGEEPPISGSRGSGTIFFTYCNLRCIFCQNYPISHLGNGEDKSAEELAQLMMKLQKRGCHNINFVTPTHMMPFILEAMPIALRLGFEIPIVYNCGGYESMEALKLLDGVVDIYLPDMKYDSDAPAEELSSAPDYPGHNREAIKEMHRQVGDLVVDEDGIALRGLIIRHLVLPEGMAGSKGVLRFIAEQISPDTHISLMSQYFPAHRAFENDHVSRGINREEYREAVAALSRYGLENGWLQDRWGVAEEEDYY